MRGVGSGGLGPRCGRSGGPRDNNNRVVRRDVPSGVVGAVVGEVLGRDGSECDIDGRVWREQVDNATSADDPEVLIAIARRVLDI